MRNVSRHLVAQLCRLGHIGAHVVELRRQHAQFVTRTYGNTLLQIPRRNLLCRCSHFSYGFRNQARLHHAQHQRDPDRHRCRDRQRRICPLEIARLRRIAKGCGLWSQHRPNRCAIDDQRRAAYNFRLIDGLIERIVLRGYNNIAA